MSQLLCTDVKLALFHISGIFDSAKDFEKISFNGVSNWREHSIISLACKLSGPCDFDGFNLEIAFKIAFSEMSTVVIASLKSLSGKSGMGSSPSVSNTLAKQTFNSPVF